MKVLTLFTLVFPLLSWSLCPNSNLANSPGFKERKQVYQSDLGWCFAFSNANIVSQKLGKPVSPVDIAIRIFAKKGVTDFDPGMSDIDGASEIALQELAKDEPYYCSENNYGVEATALSMPIYDVHRNYKIIKQGCRPEVFFRSDKLFKNLSNFEEVMIAIEKESKNKMDFLNKINSSNCKEKIDGKLEFEIKSHHAAWNDESAHERSKNYIIKMLQSGKMLSSAIDSTILFDHNISFFKKMRAHLLGDHAVTITGMEEKHGQCFIKIRDSALESADMCKKLKLNSEIECAGGQDYDIPEAAFFNALKTTTIVK